MACYAAFATWLSHSTGVSDLVVGSVVANRRRTVFEEVIGYFVNTIALRLQQDDVLSVHDYLTIVRRVITDAYDNQDVPFEVVLENLKLQREGTGPIFNIMIVLEDDPVSDLHLRNVEATVMPLRVTSLECDLVLMVVNRACGIELVAAYDADLFHAETMNRMLHQLEVLLTQMVAQPEARIVSLPMMTQEERQTILVDWNRTVFPMPENSCVHHEIIRQAERTPDAVTVVCGNESITYSELHERSNRVACVLRAWGVSSDTRVGLCLERSVDSVVAILGVLKAGGAYVPIDPGYPEQRINLILTDADVSVVVTHRGIQHRVRVSGRKILNLDAPAVFHAIGDAPDVSRPDHLAYIIYTSGSTGKPKGVEITHRSLMASLTARLHYYPAAVDRFLLTFPIAFDGSVTGIFWCLLQGGTLVIPTETTHRDPLHLGALIEAHRITHVVWVPSLYETVLRDVAPASLTSLRVVISAGESLPPQLVHQHHRVLSQASLYNEYGPTESTVWCTVYRTTPERPDVRIPIGRPIANTQVYVLDTRLEPVPIGMPGELYVAGAGVARGYVNDAALTRQRFIAHPFEAGSRVYRTGDIVRYRADGNLEYLGRADHQVKLRGHRIELSEIENVLCTYPGIHQAVVLLQKDKTGQRLVSYVVGAPEIQLELERVKSYLAMRLPPYMLPGVIIRLEAFPQTVAGKIDRRALPLPEEPGSHKPWNAAPSTPAEQALMGIWKDVLNVTEFGVDDNFFHLGGHSLLATQVASRIRETLKVECPLRLLFEHTTIAALAQALAELQEPPRISPSREIQPLPRDRAFPLSFSQQRMWFMYQLAPLATAYNIPNAVRLRGPLNRPAMDRAVRELVKRHEALRTTFAQAADGPVQIIGAPDMPSFAEADLRVLPSEERLREAIRLVEEDAAWPFDLTQGPVARLLLITLEADDHIVLLNMHHIIGDQWSFGVIGRDFAVSTMPCVRGKLFRRCP